MALLFGAATSDAVDCGNIVSAPTAFTICIWSFATTLTTIKRLSGKGGTAGFINVSTNPTTASILRVTADYTTTDPLADSAAGTLVVNKWQFLVARFDGTLAPQLFVGDLNTPAIEPAYNAAPTAPSGSKVAENTTNLYIANDATAIRAWQGREAFYGWWGSAQDIQTIRYIQQMSLRTMRGEPYTMTPGNLAAYWLGKNGVGAQVDLTGRGNAGTVTGVTIAGNPQLARERIR